MENLFLSSLPEADRLRPPLKVAARTEEQVTSVQVSGFQPSDSIDKSVASRMHLIPFRFGLETRTLSREMYCGRQIKT
jgi:hypothetical protein